MVVRLIEDYECLLIHRVLSVGMEHSDEIIDVGMEIIYVGWKEDTHVTYDQIVVHILLEQGNELYMG